MGHQVLFALFSKTILNDLFILTNTSYPQQPFAAILSVRTAFSVAVNKRASPPLGPFHTVSDHHWDTSHFQWKVSAEPRAAGRQSRKLAPSHGNHCETAGESCWAFWSRRYTTLRSTIDMTASIPSVREEKVTLAARGFLLKCTVAELSESWAARGAVRTVLQ